MYAYISEMPRLVADEDTLQRVKSLTGTMSGIIFTRLLVGGLRNTLMNITIIIKVLIKYLHGYKKYGVNF